MFTEEHLVAEVRKLVEDELLIETESPDFDLLEAGVLDSLTLVRLLLRLEERFGLKVVLDDADISDFRSIRSMACWVAGQKCDSEVLTQPSQA